MTEIKTSTGRVLGVVTEDGGKRMYRPFKSMSAEGLVDELTYFSYAAQRKADMTPEQCKSIGFSNVLAMEKRYQEVA